MRISFTYVGDNDKLCFAICDGGWDQGPDSNPVTGVRPTITFGNNSTNPTHETKGLEFRVFACA